MPELGRMPIFEIVAGLADRRVIDVEFMYKPRPTSDRARIVFDAALRSRLAVLDPPRDALLISADSDATLDSLAELLADYPDLPILTAIVNPMLWEGDPGDTPHRLGWPNPGNWRRSQTSDRWWRIAFVLEIGKQIAAQNPNALTNGYLTMPAQDAVWGRDLLARLLHFSDQHARNGLPAAVSPYTYHQHAPVPGADIQPDLIRLMNRTFGRDLLFGWKIRRDLVQAFWGKMGLIPIGMCDALLKTVDQTIWEDDLEIDRAIRALGYGVRSLWVRDPKVYRQAPPVFNEDDLRAVITRTLHYSLNIPGTSVGGSTLAIPLGGLARIRSQIDRRFARDNAAAERLIAECSAPVRERLDRFGASWVDWGAYRHVIRVGIPGVEVWQDSQVTILPN